MTGLATFMTAYDTSGSENDADGTLVVIGLAATEAKWGKLERQRQGVLEQSDVPYLQHEGPVRGSDTCRCGADVWKYGVVSRNSGAGAQTRTEDLLITNQLLYQLSYAGEAGRTRDVSTPQRGLSSPARPIRRRIAGSVE